MITAGIMTSVHIVWRSHMYYKYVWHCSLLLVICVRLICMLMWTILADFLHVIIMVSLFFILDFCSQFVWLSFGLVYYGSQFVSCMIRLLIAFYTLSNIYIYIYIYIYKHYNDGSRYATTWRYDNPTAVPRLTTRGNHHKCGK